MFPEEVGVDANILGHAFLSSPYASIVLDWNGRIIVCNRRAERSFFQSLPPGNRTLPGACMSELTPCPRDEVLARLRKGAASGAVSLPMAGTAPIHSAAETEFRLSLLRSTAKGERLMLLTQDQLRSSAEALKHMNELRSKLLQDLRSAKDDLLKLQETVLTMQAFAHAASHDLRTPINTLIGSLQLFSDTYAEGLPEKAHEFLHYMGRAARQMDRLTTELLEHSVSTASQMNIQDIDLKQALTEACDGLAQELQNCGASTLITGQGCTIHADPTLLHLVLSNLLSNAIKFRDPSRPLMVNFNMAGSGRNHWRLSVSDNGTGFAPEHKLKILLPFHRAHHEVEGTGIGLSTCAEVCRRHNWKFTADSVLGEGAVFSISCG